MNLLLTLLFKSITVVILILKLLLPILRVQPSRITFDCTRFEELVGFLNLSQTVRF